jgi:hypothetical protein
MPAATSVRSMAREHCDREHGNTGPSRSARVGGTQAVRGVGREAQCNSSLPRRRLSRKVEVGTLEK